MRKYEGLFILDPAMSEAQMKETLQVVEGPIKQFKGDVEKIEQWGNRKLPHAIKGKKEGQFNFIHFSISEDSLAEARKIWQVKDGILRFTIFKKVEMKKKTEKKKGEENGKS